MKILYITNIPFSDLEISYIRELEKLVEVKVLMEVLPSTKQSGAFSLKKLPDTVAVIPACDFPGMEEYSNMITMENWYVINNPIGPSVRVSFILARQIKQIADEFKPDLLHITTFGLTHIFLIPILGSKLPKLITVHDVRPHAKGSGFRRLFGVVCNKLIKRYFRYYLLLSHIDDVFFESKLASVEHQTFHSKLGPYDYLKKYSISSNHYGKYILFFGAIRPYKGVDVLIKAFKESECPGKGVKLVIAGKDYTGTLSNSNCNDDNIVLLNRYIENDELASLISNCMFVVLPYVTATQSGVTKSAIALNKPMLCTDAGNLPNEVVNGKYGRVVKANDVQELKAGINYMVSHEPELEKFSQNIKKDFESGSNSWETIVSEVMGCVYSRILSEV